MVICLVAYENNFKYLESWSAELAAKADRVRQLIGNRHWLTDGHHKEVIIREFLLRYTPPDLEIGSGFIKHLNLDLCSPEIDILISNSSLHPPFFNEGGIQILPPSSVVAYIEVKSTFSASSLSKALDTISNTQRTLDSFAPKVWRSICFCHIEPDLNSFADTLENSIINRCREESLLELLHSLPVCIASFDAFVVFIRVDIQKSEINLNYFEFGNLSIAVAFSDLLEHARHQLGNTQIGELSQFISEINNDNHFSRKIQINAK